MSNYSSYSTTKLNVITSSFIWGTLPDCHVTSVDVEVWFIHHKVHVKKVPLLLWSGWLCLENCRRTATSTSTSLKDTILWRSSATTLVLHNSRYGVCVHPAIFNFGYVNRKLSRWRESATTFTSQHWRQLLAFPCASSTWIEVVMTRQMLILFLKVLVRSSRCCTDRVTTISCTDSMAAKNAHLSTYVLIYLVNETTVLVTIIT